MDKDTKNEIDDYTKALLDSQKESHSSTKEEKDLVQEGILLILLS